jgi:hypothetical protein
MGEQTAAAAAAGQRGGVDRAALRVVFLSSLGGALEFYDFVVFGVFSAYIGAAFFPAGDALVSQLQTLAVFAVGYLARPIGGLLFGRQGTAWAGATPFCSPCWRCRARRSSWG